WPSPSVRGMFARRTTAWWRPCGSAGACSSFFFQAEDGIRAKLVTGVQTCALPIFRGTPLILVAYVAALGLPSLRLAVISHQSLRSEERRVGKECRFRWPSKH